MRFSFGFLLSLALCAQTPELVTVVVKPVRRELKLPGEFQPYEAAELRAAVQGFVDKVLVDRGSVVKKGQVLAELVAPEMQARLVEAQAREQVAESMHAEMEARLGASRATYSRLKEASATPGAIAGNELIQAEKAVAGAEAAAKSAEGSVRDSLLIMVNLPLALIGGGELHRDALRRADALAHRATHTDRLVGLRVFD